MKKWIVIGVLMWAAAARAEELLQMASSDLTSLSLEQLMDLEVTSVSKTPDKYFQAPAAVYVITGDDIRRSGAATVAEALRLAPGIQVQRVNAAGWAVGSRGFASDLSRYTLVLVDGRSAYDPLFAGTNWDVQDTLLEDIDRIEVIRGPGGAVWGANAVNGVINIITKRAADTRGFLAQAGGGTEERAFGAVRYGGGDSAHYRFWARRADRDATFTVEDVPAFDAWRLGQGGFRADWGGQEDGFTLQGGAYRSREAVRRPVHFDVLPYSEVVEMPIDASGGHLSGRWSRGGAAPASLRFAYDRAARKRTDMAHDLDAADAEFQQSLPSFWGQKLTYGLSYRRYWDETRGPKWFRFEPPAVTQELLGVFVQDQITVVPERVTLTLGAKSERNDYTGWENQPGARIAWTPTDHQTFWGAVSRSVRIPSRLDRDSQLTGGSVPVDPTTVIVSRFIPSPDYESEKLVAYEGGWRARSGGTVFLGIDGFFNRYDDIQSFDIPTILLESDGPLTRFVLPIVFHNGIRGRTYGGEANIVWRPAPWWRLEGVYSYLRINLEYKGAPSFDSRGEIPNPNDGNVSVFNKESQVPRHQVVLRSSMDLPRGFALDPTARYVSGLPRGSDRLPIPAYWTADLRAAWTSTGGLELAVVGQNLLQARHDESAESSNEIERGVYGKATWRWGS